MFNYTSRYFNLKTAKFATPDGREVVYMTRRFLPQGSTKPLLVEVAVSEGDRLDLITARTLGDPEHFWRVADANDAMNPFDLTAEPGRVLRVPVPQPGE
jgi:hypothetical protein